MFALSATVDHHPLVVILTPSRWGSGHSIPKPILENLANLSPQTHLHYEILGVLDTSVALSDLRSNPTLISLAVILSNGHFEAFSELQVAAHSCPNLKRLSITIKPNDNEPGPQWQDVPGKRLRLSTLQLDGCCSGVTGVSDLAAMTDMSRLKSVSILNVRFIPVLNCEGLKSLQIALYDERLDDRGDLDQLSEFLYRCKSIEELDLTGATVCMDPQLLEHLGKSLKVLRLHENESTLGPQRRRILSREQIEALGVQCPNLDILGLDIGYQGQWVRGMQADLLPI